MNTNKSECKNHRWIPLLGVDKGKSIPTSLFTCLKCGDLRVGKHTIKMSRFRMDMGELPIYQLQEMRLMNPPTADNTASGLVVTATVDTNAEGIGAPLFMAAMEQSPPCLPKKTSRVASSASTVLRASSIQPVSAERRYFATVCDCAKGPGRSMPNTSAV